MDNMKRQIFIITHKDLYSFTYYYLDEIIDKKDVSPLFPYDFYNFKYIDNIIYNKSKVHLIKSHDYIMTLPGSESLDGTQLEKLRSEESIKRGYNDWLKDKFNYSKEKINEADLCLFIKDESKIYEEATNKELMNEIRFARNKNKPILTINADRINVKKKKFSLYNENKAA